jgi:hypothetical protein
VSGRPGSTLRTPRWISCRSRTSGSACSLLSKRGRIHLRWPMSLVTVDGATVAKRRSRSWSKLESGSLRMRRNASAVRARPAHVPLERLKLRSLLMVGTGNFVRGRLA